MMTRTLALTLALLALLSFGAPTVAAQEVPATNYFVDVTGRARVQVASSPDHYYVLYFREDLSSDVEEPVSMALGKPGTTTLTENLAAYPQAHYRVVQYALSDPVDHDDDGIDDVTELEGLGAHNPFNPAGEIDVDDGVVAIPDRETFELLSYEGTEVLIDTHLENLEFVKFYLLDMHTDQPKVYFMNTETHRSHGSFRRAVGIQGGGRGGGNVQGQMRGEIVYHPKVLAPNGTLGVYRFEFEPNDDYPFEEVRRGYELLGRDNFALRNNFAYYPMPNAALPRYHREKDLYDASRVHILLEEDIYKDIAYLPLNLAEGYGKLTVMGINERPNPRDIVLYEAIPNEMPRVGGIITTVPQTPLSHVNLRAIQDGVPNAFIAGALEDETIQGLIDEFVYFRVDADGYEIRESTLAEVEAHYADQRPAGPQTPTRDLSVRRIQPLDEIGFEDWSAFGVKAANVATLRTFGFPEGTVPDGFAVPFYFYDEFMKANGLYDEVQALLDDDAFQNDYHVQEEKLDALRDRIEDAPMPRWMLDELAAMQAAFPAGTPIRVRSSTNNEDLPGFSGAGLYDSYTHHEDEGHIEKSIKQVYASLWNFRGFDERQFYRIDHFQTAMGVLVHPNYEDEQANGVGVTTDPIYLTENTYYLNTQVGENLVTNPEALSIPEEILLGAREGSGYTIVRPSNQVEDGRQVMSDEHLAEMRGFMGTIHRSFQSLYGVSEADAFAMEIEYKVDGEGRLSIKQARPWVFDGLDLEPPGPSATPAPPMPTAVPGDPTGEPTGEGLEIYLPMIVSRS